MNVANFKVRLTREKDYHFIEIWFSPKWRPILEYKPNKKPSEKIMARVEEIVKSQLHPFYKKYVDKINWVWEE